MNGTIGLDANIPPPPSPAGLYMPSKRHGSLLFISSVDALMPDFPLPKGTVGVEVTIDEARDHAQRCALNILAAVCGEAGSIDMIEQIVHIRGMICAAPHFCEHPRVLDGCSEKLIEVLGNRGRHSRSVFGVSSLPGGTTVEVEAVVSLHTRVPDTHQPDNQFKTRP